MDNESYSLKDILAAGDIVEVKHNFMLNYVDACVLNVNDNRFRIKLFNKFADISFFMQDPVNLNVTHSKDLFRINGEILFIESLDPVIFVIDVNKISKQVAQRGNKRFFVSLACNSKLKSENKPIFSIVKNISLKGFKIVSKKDIADVGDLLGLSITLDKYCTLDCDVTIIRRTIHGEYFEFGTEITQISDDNRMTLINYIDILNFGK